jgi:hypothetical protein
MLPTLVFIVGCFVFESWVRRYYKRKEFKNIGTQTEFRDLYPAFFEHIPDSGSEIDLFGSSDSTCSAMSVVCTIPDYEIVSEYIQCQPPSPS